MRALQLGGGRWAKIKDMTTTVASGSLVVGQNYIIATTGSTDWSTAGAPSGQPGTPFTAKATSAGTGTAYNATLESVDVFKVKNLKTYK